MQLDSTRGMQQRQNLVSRQVNFSSENFGFAKVVGVVDQAVQRLGLAKQPILEHLVSEVDQ
jgi:hypothetical protein